MFTQKCEIVWELITFLEKKNTQVQKAYCQAPLPTIISANRHTPTNSFTLI